MSSHLTEMFQHNRWANLRIIDWCASLDDELLTSTAPGTFGTARSTLLHLVGAEERYVELLTGEMMDEKRRLHPGGTFPEIAELRERSAASGARLVEIAEATPFDVVLRGELLDGSAYEERATTLLIQALHHGAEHRTHIMTVISQHGIEVPQTDGWTYGDEELTIG